MSQKNDELNEDELNSLLADLESRAGGSSGNKGAAGAGAEDDDEDLEAFLSRLESEESTSSGSSSPKKVATKERDDEFAAQFAELEKMQPDDLPAKPAQTAPEKSKKSKKSKKEKKKKSPKGEESTEVAKADDKAADAGSSRGATIAKIGLKWAAFALPVVVLTWVLGAFLANWVSAGWLIAIVALTFALGIPALATHFSKKGKFSWWAAGMGLLLTAALVAPMPQTAGENLTRYGHWPASAVADVAGWDANNALVQINAGAAGLLGGLLYSGAEIEANELGTDHPLGGAQEGGAQEGGPQQGEEAAASDPSE